MYSKNMDKARSGAPQEVLSAGLFYRSSGALVGRASYQRTNWNLGLSYEVNVGNRAGMVGYRGASEISLRYLIK